ncbi:hypothetical protein NW759_016729 [Fusarium solani]|nr:hypothetical protein NW759_016729 [Fusarium solani]
MLTLLDPTNIETSESDYYGVLYWAVRMIESQAKELFKDPSIATVYQPCSDVCYDPTTDLVQQPNAPDDLVIVSQFQGQPQSWYRSNYVYDRSGGEGIHVYIVDSGANLNHGEFIGGSDIASRARFLHARPEVVASDDDTGGKKGHGTCMLSRIGGHNFGVAKNANPVIVRLPKRPGPVNTVEDNLEGVRKVVDDIGNSNKRAIISMSWHYPRTLSNGSFTFKDINGEDASSAHRAILRGLLRFLVSKGVTPVTGTGHDRATSIDGFPAGFGNPNSGLNYIPELIVVGAVDARGENMYVGTNRDAAKSLP